MKNSKTKKLTTIGMLCTLAYIAVVVGRIPLVLFLKYDPKDVIIVIGGLIFGSLTSFAVTLIVSIVQMFTISGTGILGCIMNIISSCSFTCTAAFIYRKKHELSGAILGLFCGWGCQVAAITMLLYKPVVTALRRSNLIEANHNSEKMKINIVVLLVALLMIISCVLLILFLMMLFKPATIYYKSCPDWSSFLLSNLPADHI